MFSPLHFLVLAASFSTSECILCEISQSNTVAATPVSTFRSESTEEEELDATVRNASILLQEVMYNQLGVRWIAASVNCYCHKLVRRLFQRWQLG